MTIMIVIVILEDRKGTNGVSANGVTANSLLFDRGAFWVLPSTYCYLPKCARAYLFTRSVKHRYFCSGPISIDPICPQPRLYGTDDRTKFWDYKGPFMYKSNA